MIRKAQCNEAAAVQGIVLESYRQYVPVIGREPAPMRDDYLARIAANQVWVLEDEGGLAGVLVLVDGPDSFLLDNIAVRPDRQGTGVGRRLLAFAEEEAARCGWTAVTLYTNALMTANIAIYSKRGFVETGRRKEAGFDRVFMVKTLPEVHARQ